MNPKEKGIKLLDAITEDNQEEAVYLIKDGADLTVQRKGDTAIHLAAQQGNLDIIKALKRISLDHPNLHGNTPAHYAATGGNVYLVSYLKSKGANLNLANEFGHTPLHEAVMQQPMDILETFIELGMDPNLQNPRTGQTAAHIAAIYGRRMAVEALVLNGGKLGIRDFCHRKPEDVAIDDSFKQVLRMYDAMEATFGLCEIQAAGMKVTNTSALQVKKIDRVGIIVQRIENIDVPTHGQASFYCRREPPESASVPLKHFEDEHVFSDVFFLLISNVSMECPAYIYLPLQKAPSAKDELVLRFISSGEVDRTIDDVVTKDEMIYCPINTVLMPDIPCICLLYVRPRQEEFVISPEGTFIETSMEPDFSLDIPPGAFESEARLTIKVFDTQELNMKHKRKSSWGMKPQTCPLMTSVFEIILSGDQPKKAIIMQLPVTGDLYKVNEMVVLRTSENDSIDEVSDVLPVKPKFINNNLIFTINHFSTYVAVPKEKIETKNDAKQIERQLSFARERRKPATFLAFMKHTEDLSFILLVDFGLASKAHSRQRKWAKEGFQSNRPVESEAFMVTPGDYFHINIKGYATFEDPSDAKERKFCFSACRISSYQTFKVQIGEDIPELDSYYADIVIYKQTESSQYGDYEREVCRLGIYFSKPSDKEMSLSSPTPSPRQSNKPRTPRQSATPRHANTPQSPMSLLHQKKNAKSNARFKGDSSNGRPLGPCQGAAYIKSHFLSR